MIDQIEQRVFKEIKHIKKELRRRVGVYLVAAFSVVAGLAWNEAMKELLEYIFPASKDSVLAKFGYAIFVTVIVVILGSYLIRLIKKEELTELEKRMKGGH